MVIVKGMNGISAKIIRDSINGTNRLTTYELEYPRLIHSELLTHKMLSKNSSSSRAIPFKRALEMLQENPAMPVHWGLNQPGMSAKEELSTYDKSLAQDIWLQTRDAVIEHAHRLDAVKLHKQVINRMLEPWSIMKTVISGTEFENLWWLRDHEDAQPEFQELARVMHQAENESTPEALESGQWHLPYVDARVDGYGMQRYYDTTGEEMTLEDAIAVSSSCCAQVSYRRLDDSLEKARDIFAKLIGADRKHASPMEHQGTPIPQMYKNENWPDGVTHMRRDGTYCSGNFFGWIQHRQLIPNHTKW